MKYTLLDMTQTILSSMDGDEVNSISDNAESQAVAFCIRTAYYNLVAGSVFPEHLGLFNLNASGTTSQPVLMTKPENVHRIDWIEYNKADTTDTDLQYTRIQLKSLEDFLMFTGSLGESDTNVDRMDVTSSGSTFSFLFRNDKHPDYYTSYDNNTIIFDSYLSDVDATLQASKTRCFGGQAKTFSMNDTFTPDLSESQFALLLNEAKSLAFSELKQITHTKAERSSRQLKIRGQKSKYAVTLKSFDELPNYGRRWWPGTTSVNFGRGQE
jgi:hypothetical protein